MKQAPGEEARPGEAQGLLAEDTQGRIRELTDLARASGHKAAIRHAHADPPPGAAWSEADWSRYWATYERAMGLQGRPFAEAIHSKAGDHGRPEHRHRVYLALTDRGTLVRTGWDYARQEAVSRIAEVDTGAPLVKGAHNVRAARVAQQLGREDVARAMADAGLLDGTRARAALTPAERHQQERTGVRKADIAAGALAAWRSADGGPALAAALAERGLRLARGTKTIQVLDAEGASHDLRRLLAMAARAEGAEAPRAREVAARLEAMPLPSVDAIRAEAPPAPPGAALPAREEVGAECSASPVESVMPAAAVDAVPPAEAAPSPPARMPGGGRASSPSASTGVEVGDAIAPIDPSRPGDDARFMRQWAAAMAKKAAATGGPAHAAADPHDARRLVEAILAAFRGAYGPDLWPGHERAARQVAIRVREEALDSGPHPGGAGRDGGPEYPLGARPQGSHREPVCGPESGRPGGRPDSSEGAPGPARETGDQSDRSAPRADDQHGSRRAGAEARCRIDARRTARAIAAAVGTRREQITELTAALRAPVTPRTLAAEALREAATRRRAVIDGEPYPDRHRRTVEAARRDLRDQVTAQLDAIRREAAHAARRAEAARQRLGWLDRLLPTTAAQQAARLHADAEHARRRADLAREMRGDDYRAADQQARDEAASRQRQQAAWEQRPDVQRAREEERLDQKIADSIRSGDARLADLVAGPGIEAAREEVRGYEGIRRRQEFGRQDERPPGATGASPKVPSPRFGR